MIWEMKVYFTISLLILLKASVKGRSKHFKEESETNTESSQFLISSSFAYNDEMTLAVQTGDIKSIKKAIKNGGLQHLMPSENEAKLKFMTSLNEILDTLQYLLAQGIVFMPIHEVKMNETLSQEGIFKVPLVKGSDLLMSLRFNATAIQSWKDSQVAGRTPLHIICSLPEVSNDIVHFLINNGIDVNAQTSENITALHVATEGGNFELVKCLIEHGANINASAIISVTPRNATNIMKLFSKDKNISDSNIDFMSTPLNAAIRTGREDIAKYLLEQGASVGSEGSWSPLQVAAFSGNDEMVRLLLDHGAEVNGRDRSGQTALHKAGSSGREGVALALLGNGAEVNALDHFGWTPLHWAAFCSPPDGRAVVLLLLDSGAQLEAANSGGYTPLVLAVAGSHHGLLQYLADNLNSNLSFPVEVREVAPDPARLEVMWAILDRGANVDHQDEVVGWTSLHWAIASGDLAAVELLLERGANPVSRSKTGQTALDMARTWGRRTVYDILKEKTKFGE